MFFWRHQGFGVLSVILANHAIKLLTSLFQDLQVEALHRVNKTTKKQIYCNYKEIFPYFIICVLMCVGTVTCVKEILVFWKPCVIFLILLSTCRVGRVMVHQLSWTSWHRALQSRESSGSLTLCPLQIYCSLFSLRPTKRYNHNIMQLKFVQLHFYHQFLIVPSHIAVQVLERIDCSNDFLSCVQERKLNFHILWITQQTFSNFIFKKHAKVYQNLCCVVFFSPKCDHHSDQCSWVYFHQACVLQRQRKGSVSSDASASTDSNTYYEDDFSSTEEESSQGIFPQMYIRQLYSSIKVRKSAMHMFCTI